MAEGDPLLTVIIQISRWEEDATRAAQTVARNQSSIGQVIVLRHGAKPDPEPGWTKLITHQPIEWMAVLDENEIRHSAVVEMPADLWADEQAFKDLKISMNDYGGPLRDCWMRGGCDQFAVTSSIFIDPETPLSFWGSSFFWYGYLMFWIFQDWISYGFKWFQHHRSVDLRARAANPYWASRKTRVMLAPRRCFRDWCGSKTRRPVSAPEAQCMICPTTNDQGFSFVARIFQNQYGPAWNVWLLPWAVGFAIYYWTFALPWWNLFVSPATWGWWLQRAEFFTTLPLFFYAIHSVAMIVLSLSYLQLPYNSIFLLAVLYPIHLTTLPIFFFVAYFWRPKLRFH